MGDDDSEVRSRSQSDSQTGQQPKLAGVSLFRRSVVKQLIGLTKKGQSDDTDLHHICNGLFVSSILGAQNAPALKRHGITHILCVGPHTIPAWLLKTFGSEIEYRILAFPDKPKVDLLPMITSCIDYIREVLEEGQDPAQMKRSRSEWKRSSAAALNAQPAGAASDLPERASTACGANGHRILVHCFAGHSRSVSVCIAYLMRRFHRSYDEALQIIRAVRPLARPNAGFEQQLRAWEKDVLSKPDGG